MTALYQGPWLMTQSWRDVLFAHWTIPVEQMRRVIPEPLELDLWEGQAWIGVVPFWMSGVSPRFVPGMPWLSVFPELNVRAYVTLDRRPGVYFFSLDAARWLAVGTARRWFHLPYRHARMAIRERDGWFEYRSRRIDRSAAPAEFAGRYRPVGPTVWAEPGSLADFLTARYSLYTVAPDGGVSRADVGHPPWRLSSAEAEIRRNTMTLPAGIRLPETPPLLHYAERVDTHIWAPRRVR